MTKIPEASEPSKKNKTSETSEIPKSFEANEIEPKWYDFWEKNHLFKADPTSSKPKYCIVIPPPNVTGVLHMGHALVNTIQDILIRWKRMSGFETLWLPGTDHAGIATQTVVERHLIKTQGKRRKDFSREEFLKHVWQFKEENEHRIINQLKKLGCSCDWSRQRFTMDERNNHSVNTMFKKLYDKGLIYKGDYLVNWDPVTQTALADDEVEYEERDSSLWHIRYPYSDGSGYAVIATTRPETMLGDTAVAVSPKDSRYTNQVGKTIRLPLSDREIPIIEDHHVDPKFGSGMVKITPAHDPNDYQIGIRHDLPFINILTPDALINENGGKFVGLTIEDAREKVVKELKELNLIEKITPHKNRVGISYRSKATIQPYLSKQWFIKMDGFAKKLHEFGSTEAIRFLPDSWKSVYFHWVDNLRDWCISRQLWWGHRIPIWYNKQDPQKIICYAGKGLPPEVEKHPESWEQEEDVLDTWFSSALWPFASLGWPENTDELKAFYPNAVLVTGHDILFFWVARMLAFGEHTMEKLPFPETFLHGLIYGKSYWTVDKAGGIHYVTPEEQKAYDSGTPIPKNVHHKWEKMSKSKGNIINPLEIIEEYGTDAMRMALCFSATQARQIDLDRRRFEDFKNFANKIWNGARFVFLNLQDNTNGEPLTEASFLKGVNSELFTLEDHWILSVLNRTTQEVNDSLSQYHFDKAAQKAYDFFWKDFCAYYVEITKPLLFGKKGTSEERTNKQKILTIVLCQAIRLIHPMAPYITEELFQNLKNILGLNQEKTLDIKNLKVDIYTKECLKALQAPSCMVAPFPQTIEKEDIKPKIEQDFALIGEVIYSIRNIRGEMKLSPGTATDIHIIGSETDPDLAVIEKNSTILSALIRCNKISLHSNSTAPTLPFSCTGIYKNLKILIPLPENQLEKEIQRLEKEKEKTEKLIEKTEKQLANTNFTERAPEHLVKKQQDLLAQSTLELAELNSKLSSYSKV